MQDGSRVSNGLKHVVDNNIGIKQKKLNPCKSMILFIIWAILHVVEKQAMVLSFLKFHTLLLVKFRCQIPAPV